MKDYHLNERHTQYLGIVTGEQFQQKYEEMSASADKRVVASTILPLHTTTGGTLYRDLDCKEPLFTAWLFYEVPTVEDDRRELDKETGKIVLPNFDVIV